jgi:hypothetical protein
VWTPLEGGLQLQVAQRRRVRHAGGPLLQRPSFPVVCVWAGCGPRSGSIFSICSFDFVVLLVRDLAWMLVQRP